MDDQRANRKAPDMWLDPDHDPREAIPAARGEHGVLGEYLDRYRMTFELKCADLTPEQLATRSVPPSTQSLLGLLRHLAKVEHSWFRRCIEGQDLPRLYWAAERRDLDFDGAVGSEEVVADAWESWRREVAHAREVYAAHTDLGAEVDVDGQTCELRDIVVHLVEEYARHVGHADLLRECLDGRTGQ